MSYKIVHNVPKSLQNLEDEVNFDITIYCGEKTLVSVTISCIIEDELMIEDYDVVQVNSIRDKKAIHNELKGTILENETYEIMLNILG